MLPILPFFFTALSIVSGEDGEVQVHAATNRPYYAVEANDTIRHDGMSDIVIVDITAEDNAVRRYAATVDALRRPVAVTDAGPAAMTGTIDDIYVTDADGNTVTVVFSIADAEPAAAPMPEGGLSLTLNDRITATVSGSAETEYVLRYTSVVKRIDENGIISLFSVRPTTDNLDSFVSTYRVYDHRTVDNDTLMDAAALRAALRAFFPIPNH